MPPAKNVSGWLQVATVALLWGQAWDHWWGDPPYRELWWDQSWWGSLVTLTGRTWSEYVTSAALSGCIQAQKNLFGFILALTGLGVVGLPTGSRLTRLALYTSSGMLLVLALAHWKEQFWQIGQLLESSLLWTTPLIYWQWSRGAVKRATWLARGAIAATFCGHGFYALGWHPVPAHFVGMTMRLLGSSEQLARQALWWMGALDLLVAGWLLGQWRRATPALLYMTFWGLATAMARIAANLYWPFWETWLWQWWPQMVWRLAHGLVPWWLLLVLRSGLLTWPEFPPSAPDHCSPAWLWKWRRRKA